MGLIIWPGERRSYDSRPQNFQLIYEVNATPEQSIAAALSLLGGGSY